MYVTVVGQTVEETDTDWKVEQSANGSNKFTITDLSTHESCEVDLTSFGYEHNSLIKIDAGGDMGKNTFQLLSS